MAFSAAALLLSSAPAGLAEFEEHLARHASATVALGEWCAARRIASPPTIRAERLVRDVLNDPPARLRRQLGIKPGEPVAMRQVHLMCGEQTLSVAWNWFVPSRLTPQMNDALATSDTPFGIIIASLGFRRETIEIVRGRSDNCPDGTISTHRARLRLPDGTPIAYLVECYTAANLGL
ncbi:hypothetical protein [Novosphingobium sp. TH158]|uniref:hypothetical protein n=1 Tax=Novosphingobium sp. TH158 TaxID=2067455 RepID=UPI000C7D3861|nr:hypothetical protein [Novosphingobium sp. TH158]PLK24444.1 hypothetical protein C0V78_14470 [Novosphingobium sp. TH158]